MNPNKKDNNGWILCPSKSFPGKFYYFNVLNGEAAWSLNDADQKTMRKNNILHKADKSHSYPEPSSPPADSPSKNAGLNLPKTVPNIIRRFTNPPQRAPMFGQATFPNYISNVDPYMQNIIWAPIQLPVFSSKLWQDQTSSWAPGRDIFVQSCNIPLSKRFTNFEEPQTNIFQPNSSKFFNQSSQSVEQVNSSSNLVSNSQVFGGVGHSQNADDSIKQVGRQRTQSESDSVIGTFYDNNETFELTGIQKYNTFNQNNSFDSIKKVGRQRTLSESDSVIFEKPDKYNRPKSIFNSKAEINNIEKLNVGLLETNTQPKSNIIIRKPIFNPNSKILNTALFKSTGHLENVGINKKENEESSLWCNQNIFKNNDKTGSFLGNLENVERGNKKVDLWSKLDKNDLRHTLEKRRRKSVDLESMQHVEEHQYKTINSKQKEPVRKRVMFDIDSTPGSLEGNDECNQNQSHVTIQSLRVDGHTDSLYIVADSNVLFDDFDFINKFVLLDKKCILFIPYAVQEEIEGFCFGDCRGQQRVIVARQITRRLATPPAHVVVQRAEDEDEIFTKMSTLMRILNCCIQILQQNDHVVLVSDDVTLYEKAKSLRILCFRLKEIKDGASKPIGMTPKITLNNENTHNLFLQKKSHPNMDLKISNDSCKKSLFNKESSAVKIIEETSVQLKEKSRDYLNFNYDSDSDASVISKTMEKLVIKDKNSNVLSKNSNDVKFGERKNSITFQIKNKKNIVPCGKDKSSQLHSSKKESVFSVQKPNVQFLIQTKKMAGQKVIQTNKNSKFSVGDELKLRFQVTSKFMEENIRNNIDEWICTFRQTMEYTLSYFLQENLQGVPYPLLPPPWTLHEAVTSLSRLVEPTSPIATLADELSLLLLNNCCKQGELKSDIKPEEFMRVFGCGVLLVEHLQATASCPALADGQQLLRAELASVRYGAELVELEASPALHRGARDEPARHNFAKKSSDIINYLKNHFPAWNGYTEPSSEQTTDGVITQNDNKIVRTFGRNINLLTIDSTRSMTLKAIEDKPNISRHSSEINVSGKTIINSQSTKKSHNEPNVVRIFETSTPFPNKKVTTIDNDINMSPKHGNTFGTNDAGGPKVIRNIKLIDAFEDKLKSKVVNEVCSTNIESFSLTDVSLCSSIYKNDLIYDRTDNDNERYDPINDKQFNDNDCKNERNNDLDKPNDSSTNDSGFVNETDAYSVVQTFFSELSGSMKLIYRFIDDSMAEFRKADLQSGKKKTIFDKATVAHGHLTGIVYKLNCIIQRESADVTPLKDIILKADLMLAEDKRLMRYRQVVSKCLEQAQILERALEVLLAITEGDYDVSYCPDRQTFLNIFE